MRRQRKLWRGEHEAVWFEAIKLGPQGFGAGSFSADPKGVLHGNVHTVDDQEFAPATERR